MTYTVLYSIESGSRLARTNYMVRLSQWWWWRRGQRSYSTSSPVSTDVGDRLPAYRIST